MLPRRLVSLGTVSLLAALAGCSETTGVLLVLEGGVQAYTDLLGVSDAAVRVYTLDGELIGEGTTDGNGQFVVAVAAPYDDGASMRAEIEHPAFVQTELWQTLRLADPAAASVAVVPGRLGNPTTSYLPGISLAPVSEAPGTISGVVFDALQADKVGVEGLGVTLRAGIKPPADAPVVASTTTGVLGAFSFADVPAGTYTAFIEGGDAYANASFTVVSVGGADSVGQDGATTPALEEDQFRVVLSWGELPEDLDSHLSGPLRDASEEEDEADGEEQRFHVYYAEDASPLGTDTTNATVFLDVDDVTSFGPETVTARRMYDGWYRYSVHDFTNREVADYIDMMSYSRAKVQLFVGRDVFESYDIPVGRGGTVWTVFELDGATGTPYLVNEFAYEANEGSSIF